MATPINYVGSIDNEKGAFPNNQRADIMRKSMENKNMLSEKGSIYVGTGRTNTTDGNTTAETKALPVGADGQVLIADSNEETGLKWGSTDSLTVFRADNIRVIDSNTGIISYKSMVVSTSMPSVPDANTLYLIREA